MEFYMLGKQRLPEAVGLLNKNHNAKGSLLPSKLLTWEDPHQNSEDYCHC